ncbi:MAG: hypothetical protein WDO56_23860 [Gammaproteobacteria bacterium]
MRAAAARNPLLQMAAVTAGLASASASAAEWVFAPAAEMSEQTQQNPQLSPDKSHEDDLSTSLGTQASLSVVRRTERLTLSLEPVIRAYRFRDEKGLDRNEGQVDFSMNWLGEKVTWSGSASGARDTTLTSELGNTGLTQGNRLHEAYNLTFGPTWALSDRLFARTAINLSANRYPGGEATLLEDYLYNTALASLSYTLNDRASLSAVASAGRLDSEGPGGITDNASANLQLRYAWSSVLSFGIGAGPSIARTREGKQNGLLYNADLTRVFEKSALSLSISRRQAPSGFAVLTQVEDATLAFNAQLTERLTATASAGITRRQNVLREFNLDLSKVRYTHADVGVSWFLASNWRLGASFGGAVQETGSDFYNDLTARGYTARVSLSWNGNPHVK